MPGRPHHSEKMKSCVEKVMAQGHDEDAAYAICTRSLIDAGTDIFDDRPNPDMRFDEASGELRSAEAVSDARWNLESLHLCGATGHARTEVRDGKEYLVVPVIALMEGVIHPVNAATPEFVPLSTLRRAAASWNGRPVTLGHPVRNGTQCSANDPDIEASHRIGTIYNSRVEGRKMLQEAWLEKARVQKLHPEMLARLEEDKVEEVSVGTFVHTDEMGGQFNGKRFTASWLEAQGDHLAFLPGGRGACSIAMGCGTNRAAMMHFVAAESIESVLDHPPISVFTTLAEGKSLDERIQAVNNAVYEKCKSCHATQAAAPNVEAYPIQVFDDRVIVRKGEETFSVPYTVAANGAVTLGDPTPVKQVWIAAAEKECETCGGTGQIKDDDGKQMDCPTCDGMGMLKAAAGARNSAKDMAMIQTVHDHAVALGAMCDRKNLETLGKAEKEPELKASMIKHEGGKWILFSKDGSKKLGEHNSKADAEAHEQAIEAALARSK